MGKALYRKYRPKSLSEVVGQAHITDTLTNAIATDKISHAYLLTGPRGVGKTSIARILAHELNGLKYDESEHHMDIIEIDAASNRRIDEVRDLRDKVHVLPTQTKYKVYIIDEVHMLTREAFNALLKTLEEPPEHVIFILATTEAHKLPETIISRTQHFSFKPIELTTLVEHLRGITKSEKLKIDDAALQLVAEHGDGSFRDSISLLDQVRGLSDHITEAHVQNLLGIAPAQALDDLFNVLSQGRPKDLFEILQKLRGQGLQSAILARQLGEQLRSRIIENPTYHTQSSTKLMRDLLSVGGSTKPDRTLELVLLDYIFADRPYIVTKAPEPEAKAAVVETPKIKQPIEPNPSAVHKQKTVVAEPPISAQPTASATEQLESGFDANAWPIVVAAIKKKHNTLYGILRMATVKVEGETLTLTFKFAFHQKQINNSKNRKIISDIIHEQTGKEINIVCTVEEKSAKAGGTTSDPKVTISSVSDIFGGAEVLES